MPCKANHVGNALLAATLAASLLALALPASAEEDVWPALKQANFGDRAIQAEDGKVVLDAPMTARGCLARSLDGARAARGEGQAQIADPDHRQESGPRWWRNSSSVLPQERAASARSPPASASTRFSHVRAILETEDGSLHMTTKFVQAAGGCAAMNAKDPDTENVDLGKMLVKTFPPALSTAPLFEAQVMLKHPNSNGMQLDIDSGGYIPARFVKEMTVKRGNDLVFHMESTFSISTNPNFRFTFGRGGDNELDVSMVDTDGTVFTAKSQPSGS